MEAMGRRTRDQIVSMCTIFAGCVIVSGAISGCGNESVPEAYSGPPRVSGSVSLDGVPLVEAEVTFKDSEARTFQMETDSSGSFVFPQDQPNPPPGKYAVRINRRGGSGSEASDADQPLPARFNSKTELVVDVLEGQNQIDFALTTDPDTAVPEE